VRLCVFKWKQQSALVVLLLRKLHKQHYAAGLHARWTNTDGLLHQRTTSRRSPLVQLSETRRARLALITGLQHVRANTKAGFGWCASERASAVCCARAIICSFWAAAFERADLQNGFALKHKRRFAEISKWMKHSVLSCH
jgi:hypothetical protein